MMTNDEIDLAAAALVDLLKIGVTLYPPLAPAVPVLSMLIYYEAHQIKSGLASGAIVPDGRGGLIPAHGQSYYDPATGEFTGKKT